MRKCTYKNPQSVNRQMVAALRAYRLEHHITQTHLADVTGVAQPTICAIEQGTYNATLGMLTRLAAGMGVQVNLQLSL